VLLGMAVGELGERLGRADADRDGNAGPLPHAGAQRDRKLNGRCERDAVETKEGLVDGIDLDVGSECKRRSNNPSVKRPNRSVAPE